jgi:DNA-binding beta-propeller fold protein YncE
VIVRFVDIGEWEFKDTSVLQGPRGISVDNDGNVYVVGGGSSNVVVISPDGQRHRQVLFAGDGLVNPRVLDHDKATNILLVVNESAFLCRLLLVCKISFSDKFI